MEASQLIGYLMIVALFVVVYISAVIASGFLPATACVVITLLIITWVWIAVQLSSGLSVTNQVVEFWHKFIGMF